jgi:hypothetical protein
MEKVLAIFYNYTIGYFIKHTKIFGLSDKGFLDVEVDGSLPIWNTLGGRFVFNYAALRPESRILINEWIISLTCLFVILALFYQI